jgi:hypothetical protein
VPPEALEPGDDRVGVALVHGHGRAAPDCRICVRVTATFLITVPSAAALGFAAAAIAIVTVVVAAAAAVTATRRKLTLDVPQKPELREDRDVPAKELLTDEKQKKKKKKN